MLVDSAPEVAAAAAVAVARVLMLSTVARATAPAATRTPKVRRERIPTTAPPSGRDGRAGARARGGGPRVRPLDSSAQASLTGSSKKSDSWPKSFQGNGKSGDPAGRARDRPPLLWRADHLGGLQGAVGNVPPGQHAVVAAVRDDLPQGGAQRLAQGGVLLAHADAERPWVDLLAHDFEVLAAVGHLGVVGGDREVGEGGVRVPVLHVEQRLAA